MAARSFIYFLCLYKCGLITFSKVMKSVAVHKMIRVRELDVSDLHHLLSVFLCGREASSYWLHCSYEYVTYIASNHYKTFMYFHSLVFSLGTMILPFTVPLAPLKLFLLKWFTITRKPRTRVSLIFFQPEKPESHTREYLIPRN
jgi:hypothetical protein